jgi:hypothetical protein
MDFKAAKPERVLAPQLSDIITDLALMRHNITFVTIKDMVLPSFFW